MIPSRTATPLVFASLAAAALIAFWLFPSPDQAVQPLRYSSLTVSLGVSGNSEIIENPHPFRCVNSSWVKTELQARPELRASPDGIAWDEWRKIDAHPHAGDNEFRSFGKIIFFTEPMRFLQVRGNSEDLRTIDLTVVDPRPVAPQKVIATSTGDPVEKPPVVSRTDWGCPDGQGSRRTPSDSDVQFLIVHHTAGSNTSSNWAETVQAIWTFHTITRGWGDIGYNFLIDPNGVIYEGRSGGDDSIGAHFSCANTNTMGVSMIGDFTNVEPTEAALASLKHLLAWKACKEEIDPLSNAFHTGTQLTIDSISGHRDGNPSTAPGACPSGTLCPGAMLYPLLPGIRTDVAAIIASGGIEIPQLELAGRAFHDSGGGGNGDGIINPGESVRLDVMLGNRGTGTALGLTSTLSSTDPLVTITDAQKPVPDIDPGTNADETGDFNFVISPDAPDGHVIAFDLDVDGDNGDWQFTLNLPIDSPPRLSIDALDARPSNVPPGAPVTIELSLDSDQAFAANFSLFLHGVGGTVINHPSFDFATDITTGSQTKFRGLTLPDDAPTGSYDLAITVSETGGAAEFFTQTFPNALTVIAPDPNYENWISVFALSPADSAATADPDADGLVNLIEFAFDLDPSAASEIPLQAHLLDHDGETFPAITFRIRDSEQFDLLVERSSTTMPLQNWKNAVGALQEVANPDGTTTKTLRSHLSNLEAPEQFFRLRVELPE